MPFTPILGEIRMFAGNFAPAGWHFCDGTPLPISEHDALFTLIGTTYGGDGQETFALPNLQSRVPIHRGTGPGGITYQIGEAAGVEQVTLTIQQIPNHTHAVIVSGDPTNQTSPTNNLVGQSATVDMYIEDTPLVSLGAGVVAPVGGSQPHDNMQPFIVINYIIALFGDFPTPT